MSDTAAVEPPPLLGLEPLAAFLDAAGLGTGAIEAQTIGGGHSNVTFLLTRGGDRFCLRRPPRGPLPKSAHDVVREARLQLALSARGVRTSEVLAVCEDTGVIGAPFYVMAFLEGHVLEGELPAVFAGGGGAEGGGPGVGQQIAQQLVDRLAELHAVDPTAEGLSGFGRASGYLERQISRFRGLFEANATREIPQLPLVADWLTQHRPQHSDNAVVHGDYRLGNVMFADRALPEITALLDWEMATLGDPLADLGYLTANWAEGDDPADPMLELSLLTRSPGFPGREWIAARYGEATGRDVSALGWYEVLALFKAAIFLENSYGRFRAGTTQDPYFATLETGVPLLAARALSLCDTRRAGQIPRSPTSRDGPRSSSGRRQNLR